MTLYLHINVANILFAYVITAELEPCRDKGGSLSDGTIIFIIHI